MPPKTARRALGDRGEELAAAHLRRLGFRILARNYRCRWGELDCVATDGKTLCFVEVKTGAEGSGVEPEEHVTRAKARTLRRAARHYLQARRLDEESVETRFDVVAVRTTDDGAEVRLYRGAL